MGLLRTVHIHKKTNVNLPSGAINRNTEAVNKLAKTNKEGFSKVSDSLKEVAFAISDDKVGLDNKYYQDLKNKELMLHSVNEFIDAYFSFVFFCLAGNSCAQPLSEGDGFSVKDRSALGKNGYRVYPQQKMKEDLLNEVNIYITVNERDEEITLFEESSGHLEYEHPTYQDLPDGNTVVTKTEHENLVRKKEELVLKVGLLNNLEKVLYNLFSPVVKSRMLMYQSEAMLSYRIGEGLEKDLFFFKQEEGFRNRLANPYRVGVYVSPGMLFMNIDKKRFFDNGLLFACAGLLENMNYHYFLKNMSGYKQKPFDINGDEYIKKGFNKGLSFKVSYSEGQRKFNGVDIPFLFNVEIN